MTEPKYRNKGATFSEDKVYRYTLWREWDPEKPGITFILLNPSTADENVLDPTLRRCLGFAMDLGYGRMEILNLFALRSTDPKALYQCHDPIGPENNNSIMISCNKAQAIIAGWGLHGIYRQRDREVIRLITRFCGKSLHCLMLTNKGTPSHPLYLKRTLRPMLYKSALVKPL
jgi:hypothetical protein